MPKYLLLINENEAAWAAAEADPQFEKGVLERHGEFQRAYKDAIIVTNALDVTSTATVVRADREGGFLITDGAFAEVKEALGGYYLVQAADLEAAVAMAKMIPAPFGHVEIRPVKTFD